MFDSAITAAKPRRPPKMPKPPGNIANADLPPPRYQFDPGAYGARRLWVEVLAAMWADATYSVTGSNIRAKVIETAEARRAWVRFAQAPLRRSDIGIILSFVGVDPDAAASRVRQAVRDEWSP